MNNLTIRTKLRLAFMALFVAFVAFGAFSVERMDRMKAYTTEIDKDLLPSVLALGAMNDGLGDYRATIAMEVLAGNEQERTAREADISRIRKKIADWRAKYEPLISQPDEKRIYQDFSKAFDAYIEGSRAVLDTARRGATEEALRRWKENGPNFDAFTGHLDQLIAINHQGAEAATQHSAQLASNAFTLFLAGGIAVAVLVFVSLVSLERSIARPLGRVAEQIQRLAQGDLAVSSQEQERGDEVGQVSRAVCAIAGTLRAVTDDIRTLTDAAHSGNLSVRADPEAHRGEFAMLVAGINDLIDLLTRPLFEVAEVMQRLAGGDLKGRMSGTYEGDLRALKANVNRSLDALAGLLNEVAATSASLAKGDFTSLPSGTYQGEFAAIKADLTKALGELRGTLAAVARTSEEVADAAMQTTAAAHEVARQSHDQVTTLTEVAGAVSQTAANVVSISRDAEAGSRLSRSTATLAEGGRDRLGRLAEAVDRIADGNTRIGRIIDRIGRIADKTHILALNAGIEAARAGAEGAGFGLVAHQIGRLSEEVSEAARDIEELVGAASAATSAGVAAATEARAAMERIVDAAGESQATVQSITAAIAQQSAATQALSSRIEALRGSGESNAGAAEEINATMANLSTLAARVESQVTRLKLD
jgi:methyl-accepting chemotaxis protein